MPRSDVCRHTPLVYAMYTFLTENENSRVIRAKAVCPAQKMCTKCVHAPSKPIKIRKNQSHRATAKRLFSYITTRNHTPSKIAFSI
jgi:hypothetical protein